MSPTGAADPLELLERPVALRWWMGEQGGERDDQVATRYLSERLVGSAVQTQGRMNAEVPVLLNPADPLSVDCVDQLELLRLGEQVGFDGLHGFYAFAAEPVRLGVGDGRTERDRSLVAVIGETDQLRDDVSGD